MMILQLIGKLVFLKFSIGDYSVSVVNLNFKCSRCRLLNRDQVGDEETLLDDEEEDGFLKAFKVPNLLASVSLLS